MSHDAHYNPFDNEKFRKEFNDTLDAKLAPINVLVTAHEKDINRAKGAIKVLAWIAGSILSVIGFITAHVKRYI